MPEMSSRVGVVMDAIDSIKPYKDTTLALMLECQRRGYTLFYMQPQNLFIDEGGATKATVQPIEVNDNNHQWYTLKDKTVVNLPELDLVMMRKDPPVDIHFITATQILALAEKQGAKIVNRPQNIIACNEKIFASEFPHCQPPTLVSSQSENLRAFSEKHHEIILKPLHGMGGSSVFRVAEGDPNLSVIIETLTHHGTHPVMAQRFVPEIADGDKRILMINGEPYPFALARIPAKGEIRANLASGGHGKGIALTERDRYICTQVGPVLKEKGLLFVGMDVIGDYLTEINVTSPTCVRELEAQYKANICAEIIDAFID